MRIVDPRDRPPRRRMPVAVAAALVIAFLCSAAQAGTIVQFGQINPADVVTAKVSGSVTSFSTAGNADGGGVSVPVTITNLFGTPGLSIPAFETFVDVKTSGPASTVLGVAVQAVTGTIEITSGIGGTGINYVTATFTDATLPARVGGLVGGDQLQLGAAGPPDTLLLTSSLGILGPPTSMTLAFSNVEPPVAISGTTLAGFTGQNAGTFAATAIPEPASVALLGIGMSGLIALRRFFKRTSVA